MLASGGYDSTVALWDIVGDEPVQKLRLQVNMINFTLVLNSINKCNSVFHEIRSNLYFLTHREPMGPRTQFECQKFSKSFIQNRFLCGFHVTLSNFSFDPRPKKCIEVAKNQLKHISENK